MRRRPCASGSEEGVYGGLLAKESHIVEIARSGEVEDQVDGTTGRLIVDACVEKREQDVTDFLMSERRDFRDVFVDLFGRALAFAGDHFFDDFGMKREVDVDEVKRCGQLGDDAFHRSEARRDGNGCVSKFSYRWSPEN